VQIEPDVNNEFRVRVDAPGPLVVVGNNTHSFVQAGDCVQSTFGQFALPAAEADTVVVTMPTIVAMAPLHPELR